MVHRRQLLARVTEHGAESGVWLDDLRRALRVCGFHERLRGSHFVFVRRGVDSIVTLQARSGKAQPYQVLQVRAVIR
jgi:hypothetical protein